MVDQSKPFGETNPPPSSSPTPTGTYDLNTEVPLVNVPPPEILPETPPPPPIAEPTIVVPGRNGGVPKWFYLIFLLVLIAFIIVTALLVLSLRSQKQTLPPANIGPTLIPTKTPTQQIIPTAAPTISSPVPATDAAVLKLNSLSTSDEISDLGAEVESTDLSVIDQALAILDTQMGITSH
jgi:hypothetical protein